MKDWFTKLYVKASEWPRGRTRSDYAFILSAVALVVFFAYQTMRARIPDLGSVIDAPLY